MNAMSPLESLVAWCETHIIALCVPFGSRA